jgi:hypothetical protein
MKTAPGLAYAIFHLPLHTDPESRRAQSQTAVVPLQGSLLEGAVFGGRYLKAEILPGSRAMEQ